MKAKLIKTQEGYTLNDVEGNPIGQTFGKFKGKKLSLKNCQAIENGYDLDELVLDYEKENEEHIQIDERQKQAFKIGFQKALEILSDNKYSEENIEEAFAFGQLNQLHNQKYFSGSKAYIQSLQQTEWNVIIKTTCDGMVTGLCMPEVCDCNIIPKLDADGCLILKRK